MADTKDIFFMGFARKVSWQDILVPNNAVRIYRMKNMSTGL